MRTLSVICALLLSTNCIALDLSLQPDPGLTPTAVVQHQLDALQANDGDNRGIAATYRFASPRNKNFTGPLERFSRLFDNAQYQPMLNHRSATVKLVQSTTDTAELVVSLVGNGGTLHWYRFRLSRQPTEPFQNCWMTDAVMLEKKPERSA